MPQAAPVVLTDGTTPRTFTPDVINDVHGKSRFRTTDQATFGSQSVYELTRGFTSLNEKPKSKLEYVVSHTDSESGQVIVDHKAYVNVEATIPKGMSDSDRATLMALAKDQFDNALFAALFGTGEATW